MIDESFINELYDEEIESKDKFDLQIEMSQLSESDQELLQEMYFSKKDLQDPKTIEKIEKLLDRTVYDTVYVCMITILYLLPIVISIIINPALAIVGFIGGLTLTLTVIAYTFDLIKNMPQKVFDKNYEKFKTKVTKLKEETKKKLDKEKNPKYITKYKEIIANCDKVLKAIQDREKKIIKEKEEKDYNTVKKAYTNFINFLENPPHCKSEWQDLVYIAQNLKISEVNIATRFKKKFDAEGTLREGLLEWLYGDKNKSFESDVKLGGINLNIEVDSVELIDDTAIFIGKDCNIYYMGDDYILEKEKFFKFFSNEYKYVCTLNNITKFKEYLIEVDKELGYYRLSEPPKNVKRKQFPL